MASRKNTASKVINLALQGGGAQGAYTWGVLDRLLEDERIEIEGISGTSAGAISAAVLVSGFAENGRTGARQALENFWRRTSEYGLFSPLRQTPWDRLREGWNLDASPAYTLFDIYTRLFSPKERNPFNLNPVQQLLEETIDIKKINAHKGIRLFIAATCVQTGQPSIFCCEDLTIDALRATSSMPFLFEPVEIKGKYYWDGGYVGNPAIWPLIYHCDSRDIMLVQINPFMREKIPQSGSEIINRLNEITFNCALVAELRAIRFVSKLIHEGKLKENGYKDLRMHLISSPEELHDLNASSKMNVDWEFFIYLRDIGRDVTDKWLKKNFDQLGIRATFNFDDMLPPEQSVPKAA